jgi:hypothetical protein
MEMTTLDELEAIRARHVEDKAFCVVMRIEHPPQIQDIATLLRLLDATREELREVREAANLVLRDASKMVNELSLDEGTYEMANLRQRTTGLPFVVFVSQRGKAQHPCRVKISKEPQTANFFASVSVNDPVEVKSGHVRNEDMIALKKWILLNQEALLQYWDGDIQFTEDLLKKIKPV